LSYRGASLLADRFLPASYIIARAPPFVHTFHR